VLQLSSLWIGHRSLLVGILVVWLTPIATRAQSWNAVHSTVTIDSPPAVAIENETSPAALLEPSWMIEVFYRGANQHLWDMVDLNSINQGGYSNAVTLNAGADALVWKGKVVVFYQGSNQHLFIASKPTFQPLQAFNSPMDTGYGPLTSSPTVGTLGNDEVDVFYRGANGHLWEMHFKDLTHWTAPEDLGGVAIQSRASVVSMRDQSNKMGYQVLYVGPNGHIWKSYWPSDLKKRIWWSAPEDLGGEVVTAGPTSINLPSSKGGATDRGIQTFYLTDSPTGTNRLRFSTWVGYDSKGATDWWSAPQQIVVDGANFSADLGSAIFGVTGPEIFYRDGQGHYSKLIESQAPPPPSPPKISKLTAAPDNGYVNKGQPVTISWEVDDCGGPCSVVLKGLYGIGFTQTVYSAANLPTSGYTNTVPSQQTTMTNYVLTATGSNGSATKTITVSLAPSSAPSCPMCTIFYFKLTNSSPNAAPSCFTQSVYAQNEQSAQQLVENENPGYTVTQTTADGFLNACNQ
jgi:hypothetical protein